MLLFVTNNCWTRSFTLGYWLFSFSCVVDSNEDKNLCRENILSNEYACCLSTINHIMDSHRVTVGSCIILNQVVAGSTWWGIWTCIILTYKSVSTYESHTKCALVSRYDQLRIIAIPYFGCVSCFGKIYKICLMTRWYYVYLSSISRISLCLWDVSG